MSWQIPTQIEQDIIAGKAKYQTFQTGNGGQSILPVPPNSYAVIFGYDFSPAGGGLKTLSASASQALTGNIALLNSSIIRFFETQQISFEDLIGGDFSDDLFVKVESTTFETPKDEKVETVLETVAFDLDEIELHEEIEESKSVTLNEKLAKGINIDLNDRIAFTKHLFGNDPEDYNRVLNQLITFNTFYETRDFIRDMVKPDYNNWEGKEEYEERFMEIIEKKFL